MCGDGLKTSDPEANTSYGAHRKALGSREHKAIRNTMNLDI